MENTCVCCGSSIPEGRQVCYACERETLGRDNEVPNEKLGFLMWLSTASKREIKKVVYSHKNME